MQGIFLLKGTVKHYDWGGYSFIPGLLNVTNPGNQPFAEYWMGTHHLGMSQVLNGAGETAPLSDITAPLPYLFKVLDVKDMLSIQVHPSKKEAESAFARENAEGIPLDSPLRNYKDDNHKPELMVALSDFWLLHGFNPKKEMQYALDKYEAFNEFSLLFKEKGYASLIQEVFTMPQQQLNELLLPLCIKWCMQLADNRLKKEEPEYWAAKAAQRCEPMTVDRGIIMIFLMNLVHLNKGEAIYQDAGVPHAYLEGQNIEVMANSDNVLRGGLTTKNIDVKELLKHTKYEATVPQILEGDVVSFFEKQYKVPVPDFRLSRLDVTGEQAVSFRTNDAEILLLTEGKVLVKDETASIPLKKGQAVFCLPGTAVNLETTTNAVIFRAGSSVHISE